MGQFKLSSGGTTDYYIDCRTTTLRADGTCLTARVFLDEIQRRNWRPKAIGGLTMGADPIVVSVAMLSSQMSQPRAGATAPPIALEPIHGFLVRKAEKAHGTGQRIEGFREKGARVVIVDDVCTTGASTVQAIAAAREFGFEIVGVMCLVERLAERAESVLAPTEVSAGRLAVERAAEGVPFVSIFTSSDVFQQHLLHQD